MRQVSHRPGGSPVRAGRLIFSGSPIFWKTAASLVVGFIRVAESKVVRLTKFAVMANGRCYLGAN
jgi:hypothetical protein